jgi:hypothetical protein
MMIWPACGALNAVLLAGQAAVTTQVQQRLTRRLA